MLKGEDRFRVETGAQIIVSDGKTLWSYSIPDKRVIIDNLAADAESMLPRRILFHYTKDYDVRVDGRETIGETESLKLSFTSSSGETMFPRVDVWVNPETWMVMQVRQQDINENETVYLLRKVETTCQFPAGTFTLTIPAGVEVVDMR